jgi:hypothetical protein
MYRKPYVESTCFRRNAVWYSPSEELVSPALRQEIHHQNGLEQEIKLKQKKES